MTRVCLEKKKNLWFHTIADCTCVITIYSFSTESNLLHVELSRMNYSTGPELHVRQSSRSIQHSYHFVLSPKNSLLICPNFKVNLRQAFQEERSLAATELVQKYILSKSPSWFIALGYTLTISYFFA